MAKIGIPTWQFQKVQFQDTCDNGYLILLKNFLSNRLAVVDNIAEVMSSSKRNIGKPYGSTSFIALKVGVIYSKLEH